MNQARTDVIRLAKAVPLVSPKPNTEAAELDSFIEAVMSE